MGAGLNDTVSTGDGISVEAVHKAGVERYKVSGAAAVWGDRSSCGCTVEDAKIPRCTWVEYLAEGGVRVSMQNCGYSVGSKRVSERDSGREGTHAFGAICSKRPVISEDDIYNNSERKASFLATAYHE